MESSLLQSFISSIYSLYSSSSSPSNNCPGPKNTVTHRIIENTVFPSKVLIEGNVSSLVAETNHGISCYSTNPDTHCCVKSNNPIYIHPQHTSMYFEITITKLEPDSVIVLGLTTLTFPSLRSLPGWEKNSFGYHSDNGSLFSERGDKALFELAAYGEGDTVGIGIENDALYFVKNGVRFQSVVQLPQSRFYFSVGMGGRSSWTYNFGTSPFVYSITPKQFKQSLFDSPNIQHPLLNIPQCLWPFFVTPNEKTDERHQTWVALLSTCHAIRDYLFPLFRYVNPSDFCELVEGYYIKEHYELDHYYYIQPNYEYNLWRKIAGWSKTLDRKGKWHLKRTVVGPFKQVVSVVLDRPSIPLEFEFERGEYVFTVPAGKVSRVVFEERLSQPKRGLVRKCGAAVMTGDPCCHDAVRDIARNIFDQIPKDQCSHMNDVTILLPSVVERIAIACMQNAMTTDEIEEAVTTAILQIAPDLTPIMKKLH